MINNNLKQQLVKVIIDYLQHELTQAKAAANSAYFAAVDKQSVAETQYDTLAIEASYLAEGQSKRVLEYQQALTTYQALTLPLVDKNSVVSIGCLVLLAKDLANKHWFFIGPDAGGFRYKLANQQFTVITSQSPMAKALLGKGLGDDIEIILGSKKLTDEIIAIY
jgi:transcription elongation GreA/GreB family factor